MIYGGILYSLVILLLQVTIFHKCEPEFLHDLVLKMKTFIYTPDDLVCRKGEVAREMFIIADGLLEVIRYFLYSPEYRRLR